MASPPQPTPVPGQLALPLDLRRGAARDRGGGAANAAARAALDALAAGSGARLAVIGPPKAGKTALLQARPEIQRAAPSALAAGADILETLDPAAPAFAVDAADAPFAAAWGGPTQSAYERGLLHLLNRAAVLGRGVALTARSAPARWPVGLRDLASRLATLSVIEIDRPDEALMARLMGADFERRGLRVAPATLRFLALRLPRDYQTALAVAETLDQAALRAKRPIGPSLAAETLGRAGFAF